MKRSFNWITLLLLVLSTVLSACNAPRANPTAAQTPSPAIQISTLDELIAGLEASGTSVEQGEIMEDSFFGISGKILLVNGITLTVWEFQDEAAQQAAAATISGGGFIIGTTAVDWVDQPNFFAQSRLIVLYVGKDQAMIDLLTRLLGPKVNQP